jgi:transposase-like protein
MKRERKQHGVEVKAKVAVEAIRGLRTVNEIAGEYGIHPTQVTQWKKQALAGLSEVFSNGRARQSQAEAELRDQLYEEIGRLKFELDWLKKKLGHAC